VVGYVTQADKKVTTPAFSKDILLPWADLGSYRMNIETVVGCQCLNGFFLKISMDSRVHRIIGEDRLLGDPLGQAWRVSLQDQGAHG
jgi:hypothetical protein